MSVKSKSQLKADNDALITTNGTRAITGAIHNSINEDLIDSYDDVTGQYTTTQRDALTGMVAGVKIYNTTNKRIEYYDGSVWKMVGFPREKIFNIKATANNDYTQDENNDWRIKETSGSLFIQKLISGVWTNVQEFSIG